MPDEPLDMSDLGDELADARRYAARAKEEASEGVRAINASLPSESNARYVQVASKASMRARAVGREQALREAVAELAAGGIPAYTYTRKDGVVVHVPVDVGIRRVMNDAMREHQLQQTLSQAERLGENLVEVSITANARKSHEAWQGKVYQLKGSGKYPNFYEACMPGDKVNGIGGYNCGHQVSVYYEDLPKVYHDPLEDTGYTTEQARALVSEQRRLEREERKAKREAELLDHAGLDAKQARARAKAWRLRVQELVESHPEILRRQANYREAIAPIVRNRVGAKGVVHGQSEAWKNAGFFSEADWVKKVKRTTVDLKKILSKTYAAKAAKAFGQKLDDDQMAALRRMLKHRSGTLFEDIYAFNMTNGGVIDSVVNQKTPQRVRMTPGMRAKVANSIKNGSEVAVVHNHPMSSLPSASDLRALEESGAAFGVIAAHDGSIIAFRIVKDPDDNYRRDAESIDLLYYLWGDDGEEAIIREYYSKLGVRVERIP